MYFLVKNNKNEWKIKKFSSEFKGLTTLAKVSIIKAPKGAGSLIKYCVICDDFTILNACSFREARKIAFEIALKSFKEGEFFTFKIAKEAKQFKKIIEDLK